MAVDFTLVDDPNNALPQVTEFVLVHDTGTSADDAITGDSRVSGVVGDDGSLLNLLVQIDHDGDGVAEGIEYTGLAGEFAYRPQSLVDGPVTLRARAGEWNPERFLHLFGPWTTLTFTLDAAANLPPGLTDLRLKYDTGESSSDLVTHDATIAGTATNDGQSADLLIEFDTNGDGRAEGVTRTDDQGKFAYAPPGVVDGETTVQVRAREWVPGLFDLAGAWTPLSFTLDQSANLPPVVATIGLFDDTGESTSDGVTTDPRLVGLVGDDGELAGLTVEFDQNGDGFVDGSTTTDSQGQFRYSPDGLAVGVVTIQARAVEGGDQSAMVSGQELAGAWISFSFTLDAGNTDDAPAVASLELFKDGGESTIDGVTPDPRVRGSATNDDGVDQLRVEFDHNGDGFAEAYVTTDAEGDFVYTPQGLAAGAATIRARAGERLTSAASYRFGAWASLTFTLEAGPANLTPEVFKVRLLNDRGSSASDKATWDASLIGSIANDDGLLDRTVEFDHNGDGEPDGTTQTDTAGRFVYLPEGLPLGEVTIKARATETDAATQQTRSGDWVALKITLEAKPADPPVDPSLLPRVVDLGLARDTGESASDGVTTDPAAGGSVANVDLRGRLIVEFDHNNDGVANETVRPDWSGKFVYGGEGLAAGAVTLKARAGEWDDSREAYLFGEWVTLSYTLQADATNTAPTVATLGLDYDTGASASDAVTSDAGLHGSVTDNGHVDRVLVEFDHNGDGFADGSVRSSADGSFQYRPTGLVEGTATVRARAREWDPGQAAYVYGQWTTLNFTLDLDEDLAPAVTSIALVRDTGASASDAVTSDPAIVGSASNEGNRAGLRVEFDQNADGVAEASVLTSGDGGFWYIPVGLVAGPATLRARVVETPGQGSAASGPELASAWTSFSFTLAFDPNEAAEVATLGLKYDTGSSASDGVTSDPRLAGTVTNDGNAANLQVEFDHDGDGVADGHVYTGEGGSFVYAAPNVAAGSVTMRARVREWDAAQNTHIFGAWASLSFTLDAAADLAPTLTGLALLFDTGASATDKATRDPRLIGSATNDGERAGLHVEFDHNGDGAPDGSAVADAQGRFLYTPEALADGAVAMHVRVVELSRSPLWGEGQGAASAVDLASAWTTFDFTLDLSQDAPPAVTTLALKNDNGAAADDGVTSDATLAGQATNDGGLLHMVVEFDHNADGTPDGSTITDYQGKFSYEPQGLSLGSVTIRARAKARDFGQAAETTGDWASVSFTLEAGGPAGGPEDAFATGAVEAYELAVAVAVGTFNDSAGRPGGDATITLGNASYSPLAASEVSAPGGAASPVTATALAVTAQPSVPAESSHSGATTVSRSGTSSGGGSYSSTATVTTTSSTTTSGGDTSGTFSESESLCSTFSHAESGPGYTLTASGNFCFEYTASGSYSIASDGSVSISASYTIDFTSGYDYSFSGSETGATTTGPLAATETVTVVDDGTASFTYNESGSFSAGGGTSSLGGSYVVAGSAQADTTVTASGNYAMTMPLSAAASSGPSGGSMTASGNYTLVANSLDVFNKSGMGSVGVNGSSILVTASQTVTGMSMGTLSYSDSSTYSGGGAASSSAVTLGMSDMTNSFSTASVTATNTTATINATFNNASIYGANYTANDSASFSSSGPWGSSRGSDAWTIVASMNGFSQVGGSLIGTQSSYALTGNFLTSSVGSVVATGNGNGSYTIGGTSASYVTSAALTGTYSAMAAGGFSFSNSADFVGMFFSVSSTGSSNYARVENGSHNAPGFSSTYKSVEIQKDASGGGATGSLYAGTAGSGASILINGSHAAQASSVYDESGSRSGAGSSTFNRHHMNQVVSSGGFTAKLYAAGAGASLIGNFNSSDATSANSSYHEIGTNANGDSFQSDLVDTSSSNITDAGNFSLGGPAANVTGDYSEDSNSTHYAHYESAGGSMSSNYHEISLTDKGRSDRSVTASYSVTASAASQTGDYDTSQSASHDSRQRNAGMYFAPGLSAHYDEVQTSHSSRTDTDKGTFTDSNSTGRATGSTSHKAGSVRDENGTRSGDGSSTFTSHQTQGSYDNRFAENNYGGPDPHGKYSNQSNASYFSQYDENGTRSNGDGFSIHVQSNGVTTYNDSGKITGSGGDAVHNGNYVLNENRSLTQTNAASGTLPGGSWNTNHTFTSNSRLKDDAGYTRSSTGISGNGNFDSYRFASNTLTSSRNGTETVGAVTTTFNESYFEKSSGGVSDKGTYGLSPTGKTPSGHIDGNHMYILSTNGTTTIVVNGGGVNTTETRAGNHLLQKTTTDKHDYAPGGSVTGGLYQYNVMDNATTTHTLTGTITADGCSETIDDGSSGTQMYTYNDQEQYGNGSGSGVAKLKNVVDGSVASDRVLTCPGLVRHTMASGTHHVELSVWRSFVWNNRTLR